MEISIILARILGVYFIVVILAFLFNREKLLSVTEDLLKNKGLIFVLSVFTVMLGATLVVLHNVWIGTWEILITIIAWASLIKGALYLITPDAMAKLAKRVLKMSSLKTNIWLVVMVLVALILLYNGFLV